MESKKKKFEGNNSSQLDNECRNGGKDEKTDDDGMGKTENGVQIMDHQYESEREHNDDNDDDDVVLARKNELPTAINKLKSTEETIKDGTDDSDVKPSHSYIALIAMAILSCANKKMILGDIYQYISDNYPYYRNKDKSWRNSIRHNLSLNECFIKAGRSENGKGNYWAIHPANLEDFSNGDFRRRRARRRVRKSNALKFSNGLTGFSYYRSYTPLSAAAYSTFLPYKNDDYSRMYPPVSGYSSYALTSGNRKNFAIDNIIAAPTNYKQYYHSSHPSLMYDQSMVVSPYPLSLSSESTLGAARCSPVPNIMSCADRPFVGPYSSSLSALASLSSSQRGNESWQDTLCKLQENLKKPSYT